MAHKVHRRYRDRQRYNESENTISAKTEHTDKTVKIHVTDIHDI